jgi:hypothetical protein
MTKTHIAFVIQHMQTFLKMDVSVQEKMLA